MSSRSHALPKQQIFKQLRLTESAKHGCEPSQLCLPLHMVPEQLRDDVFKENLQTSEWRNLFASEFDSEVEPVGDGAHYWHNCDEALDLPVDTGLLSSQLSKQIRDAYNNENRNVEQNGLLVNGDNATYLKSIGDVLSSQVRMIYLDPPYNTGNTHYEYNDKFQRSDWLAMMRRLLEQLLPALASDGCVCVSIDDSEMPYLRVLMDELIGEKKFVACVAYERSGSAGLGQGGVILNTKEYILIYSLDKRALNDIGYERPIDKEVMRRYNKVLINEGRRILLEEIETSGQIARLYRHEDFRITSLSLKTFERRRDQIESQFTESFDLIFRTQNVQKENSFQNSIIAKLKKDEFYSLDYIPSRGKYKSKEKTLYYWNGELCAWLKDSAFVTDSGITKRNKLTDFWSHAEIPKADLANEGGVLFSRSKKPEHLMHRLIALTTNQGDLVLDPFLGSGSSAAVAHKMGRRWIGIESGQHFANGPLTRMKRVIKGDQTGVSRLTDWRGGGTFCYQII